MTDESMRGSGAALDEQDVDQETAEKLAEIEQTREAIHGTVEEIGDRLAPSAIVENAKETVRDATVGKVEDMAESAGQMFNQAGTSAQQAGYGIMETVRRNPIPAAMAGIGLAWLVTHRSTASAGSMAYGRDEWRSDRNQPDWRGQRYDRPAGYRVDPDSGPGVKERIGEVGDTLGERAGAVGDRVGEVGDQIGQKLEQGVDSVSSRVGDVPDEVTYRMRDLGDQARSFLDQSPLAVGVVAVAVGTAVGAALPVTQTERRVLGPATERMIGTAERTATQALSEIESGQTPAQTDAQGRSTQSQGGSQSKQSASQSAQAGSSGSGTSTNAGTSSRSGSGNSSGSGASKGNQGSGSTSTKASTRS